MGREPRSAQVAASLQCEFGERGCKHSLRSNCDEATLAEHPRGLRGGAQHSRRGGGTCSCNGAKEGGGSGVPTGTNLKSKHDTSCVVELGALCLRLCLPAAPTATPGWASVPACGLPSRETGLTRMASFSSYSLTSTKATSIHPIQA